MIEIILRSDLGSSKWLRASLFGVVMIATCWLIVVFLMSVEREKTIEGAIQRSEGLVRLFETDTAQTLSGIDRTLLLLRNAYEADPSHFDLRSWTERAAVIGDMTIQSSIFGPNGFMRATATEYDGPPLYVGDQEQFVVHVDAAADKLFISEPLLDAPSGKFLIQLSRRIRTPAGHFDGIIVASLDPKFIDKFYETADLGSRGTIVLRNLDGVILAARGLPEPTVGRPGLTPALRNALAHATAGHYWGAGAIDGVNRLVGYRVFERSPLLGTVGRAESVIFETYRHNQINYLVIATTVTILALIAIAGATRYQIRLDRARNELRRCEAETQERAQKLELKSRELEVTLEYMGQGIIMTDAANNVPVINRRAIELLGLPGSSPIDQPTIEHILKSDRGRFGLEPLGSEQSLKSGPTSPDIQVYQRSLPNGVVLEIHYASLQDGGTVRTISDITERTHAEEEVVRTAHHDALTGLPNRLLLHDRIDEAIRSARQNEETFAILCLDLDRFKIANDTFGHQAGDGLLKDVAGRLSQCVRDVDTVARVGGDEFVVLQAKVSKPEDVAGMAKRILMVVGAPYKIKGNSLVLGASIGIALAPRDGASADELLGHADLALYRAKSNGRNDFSFFDVALGQSAKERATLELELREALAKGELEVWYQPWVNVLDRKIAGCEALLRWRHPVRGLIAPIEFIPTAEETGLIRQLGNLVLRRACQDATTWPTHVKLAINLSAVQFIGGTLSETVLGVLAETGLEAKRLELEITETLMIDDYEEARAALFELRRHGISIALDDFGTGYSSLTHLRQLLVDRIKIDRSFIAEMTERADCVAIVSTIIALGNTLGIKVTAEGVETEEQFSILQAVGCTEAQGYLFSRPVPSAEMHTTLSGNGSNAVIAA